MLMLAVKTVPVVSLPPGRCGPPSPGHHRPSRCIFYLQFRGVSKVLKSLKSPGLGI